MHATNAAFVGANTAAATEGAGGAAMALYHSGRANHKLMKKVEKKRGQLARDAARMSDEEVQAALLDHALREMAERYYRQQHHETDLKTFKKELEQMAPCDDGSCDCPDYDHNGENCVCGHRRWHHTRVTAAEVAGGDPKVFEWLLEGVAEDAYPSLKNRNGEGAFKDQLYEIDTCNTEDCLCFDFDLCESNRFISRRCRCGHRYREHTVTGRWEWIVVLLAQQGLAAIAEENSSDSSSSSSSDSDSSSDDDSDDDSDLGGVDDTPQYDYSSDDSSS